MRIRFAVVAPLAALLLFACDAPKESPVAPTATPAEAALPEGAPPATGSADAGGEAGSGAGGAPLELQVDAAAPDLGPCVAACVFQNQMVATSAEAIESGCVDTCNECFQDCTQSNMARAVAPEVIEADCARECEAAQKP